MENSSSLAVNFESDMRGHRKRPEQQGKVDMCDAQIVIKRRKIPQHKRDIFQVR